MKSSFAMIFFSRFFLGSNKVMQVALGRSAADEIMIGIHKVSKASIIFFKRAIIITAPLSLSSCVMSLTLVNCPLDSTWRYWALFYQFAKRRGWKVSFRGLTFLNPYAPTVCQVKVIIGEIIAVFSSVVLECSIQNRNFRHLDYPLIRKDVYWAFLKGLFLMS